MTVPDAYPTATSAQLQNLSDRPAELPPPGMQPNFINPGSSMKLNAEVCVCFTFLLSTLVLALHVFSQIRLTRKFRLEDWLLILTWIVLSGAGLPISILMLKLPLGVHQWDMTVRHYSRYLFLEYTSWIIWGIVVVLLKVIILLQYIRLFSPGGVRNLTYWASHILLWVNVLFYILFTFLQMFSCSPREAWWNKTITPHKCLDIFAINIGSAAICLFSDLTIFLLPQRVALKLHTSTRRKMGICGLFAIGILACVTSVVRLYYNIIIFRDPHDVTYKLSHINVWAMVQIQAGFLIICLPSMPKFFIYLRGSTWLSRIECYIKSMGHVPNPDPEKGNAGSCRVATIGGGGKRNIKGPVISDREFQELVNAEKSALNPMNTNEAV